MPVFDGSIKVPRAVADPKTDKNLPAPQALSWGAIKSVSALAGTTGVDAKLVHGDRYQVVDANMTTNIAVNEIYEIGNNQTITVGGNCTETVMGNLVYAIFGTALSTFMGAATEDYLTSRSELMLGQQDSTDATAHYENKLFDLENIAIQQQNIGVTEGNIGAQILFLGLLSQVVLGVNFGLNTVGITVEASKLKSTGVTARVDGFLGKIFGGEGKVGGGEVRAAAGVNALPDVRALTPFG